MKTCPICKKTKQLTDFYSNGIYKGKPKYKPTCKHCEKKHANIQKYERLEEAFGGPLYCEKCGYKKNYAALEFHHLDPSTKDKEGILSNTHMSLSVIKNEMEKCICVCSRCHRELHYPQWNK